MPSAPIRGYPGRGAALGRERVDLVEEDDAWRVVARALEELAHVLLRLADVARDELGTLDRDEGETALGRDRLGHQRLTGAGRAV